MVTRVEDPSRYGVVVMDAEGKIDAFVEKPKVGASLPTDRLGKMLPIGVNPLVTQ